jgi:hypothetical protein
MVIEDRSKKLNGYKVRSWGDLAAVVTTISVMLAMLISTVLWGLKLESELNVERNARISLERKVARNSTKIDSGILDVARSEINDIRQDDREIKRRLERLENRQ